VENKDLVNLLVRKKYITSERIKEAFLSVDRGNFVRENLRDMAYYDEPLPIGYKQTISAPSIVAVMITLLNVEPSNKILEIGTGSGYNACLLAALGKKVYTIERIPELRKQALENLKKCKHREKVVSLLGDGSKGYPPEAPYDRILVTCGAPDIPQPLIRQLAEGGRMVIPVGSMMFQELYIIEKKNSEIKKKIWGDVAFVPMIGTYGHRWA